MDSGGIRNPKWWISKVGKASFQNFKNNKHTAYIHTLEYSTEFVDTNK
jgi:hypothetical protein